MRRGVNVKSGRKAGEKRECRSARMLNSRVRHHVEISTTNFIMLRLPPSFLFSMHKHLDLHAASFVVHPHRGATCR